MSAPSGRSIAPRAARRRSTDAWYDRSSDTLGRHTHVPTLTLDTRIAAPIARCFDLARDVQVHARTLAATRERVVPPGRTEGLLEAGDLVIFEGRHFGLRWRLSATIAQLDRPHRFVDVMVAGPFASLRHTHAFTSLEDGATLMRDHLEWRSPLGWLGAAADRLALRAHLAGILRQRAQALQRIAESAER